MTTKEIVDQHFTQNIKYYESLCKKHFNGRYLWEDLLQETYLGLLKSQVLHKSTDNNYLLTVGTNVCGAIFQKRKTCKKHCDGKDSPLFETAEVFCSTFDNQEQEIIKNQAAWAKGTHSNKKQLEVSTKHEPEVSETAAQHIEEIKALVFQGLEKQDHDIEVFVMSQIESINEMSKRTGISRYCLTKANNRAKDFIKKNIAA